MRTRSPDPVTGFKSLLPIPRELIGERICLRGYEDADVPALVNAIDEARETLAPWMPWVNEVKGYEDRLDYVRRMRARFDDPREDIVYGIFARESGEFLGGTGVHRIKWDIPSFEIGYWLRPSAHGHGIASESTRLLTVAAFDMLGAARVEVRCDATNTKSRNVPERLGFIHEATLRCDARTPEGALRDTLVFALTWDCWRARLRYPGRSSQTG
jgi:RimJ/RimL family protein N-acetyltransferase